ncbi:MULTISPECIES: transglutaminase family protein [Alphaproteobacteria]|uniref:Transglutaminase n=2 Tax=Alphaproteobacteria TaxID=28211 RepID=A0A512HF60_9HYPH|nr:MULTISPECIES: transglutaminase family protein [Alphaproteobacteria]GEO84071.1 transglutaminase [Ciceribacter naphthalenivorans]GLR21051.1 transglutaminase [Ciceribacter naphthalenivorans]GLT03907.1 transglutaminase [Sphingomonas psychrolutea]
MRLKITHTTLYRYEAPVLYSLQRLRLTPPTCALQHVESWHITVDGATVEAGYNDQFGNHVHLVSTEGEAHEVRIEACGEVVTQDNAGVFGPHVGFCPLWLFLRDTPRTKAGKLTRELVKSITAPEPLTQMHDLMETIHQEIAYLPGRTDAETTAEQALETAQGVCQDHAHVMIAAARCMGVPARYVSGYLKMDEAIAQAATHAWAEVHLPGLGWVGFDAANNHCPDARYVRLATGLCYADAAPVSGMRIGPAGEDLDVSVVVDEAKSQSQSQSQS